MLLLLILLECYLKILNWLPCLRCLGLLWEETKWVGVLHLVEANSKISICSEISSICSTGFKLLIFAQKKYS